MEAAGRHIGDGVMDYKRATLASSAPSGGNDGSHHPWLCLQQGSVGIMSEKISFAGSSARSGERHHAVVDGL